MKIRSYSKTQPQVLDYINLINTPCSSHISYTIRAVFNIFAWVSWGRRHLSFQT